MNEKLEAALAYAARGWAVLPVVPGEKLPASLHGVHDATTDENQIRKWWGANPEFNIGIAAGQKSGLIVFDVDPRNGGVDTWEDWVDRNGIPNDVLAQCTAGGGNHYIAHYTTDFRSCKLGEGVDVLSDGRYFLAAPSVVGGREYFWDEGGEQFEVPQRWVDSYRAQNSVRVSGVADQKIIKGNRNAGLTAIGGALRQMGLTQDEILATLKAVNQSRCDDPLEDDEVERVASSVSRYEADRDVAASAALGSQVAEELLRTETGDYYLTKATAFLTQPAPLQWVIRGWIPAGGLAMLYGESGVGKTFITLDMALCVATGLDWMGCRVRQGVVVYLCGEGNYGLRLRVAAWAKHRGRTDLQNLVVSNRSIDITSATAHTILAAVREVTSEPVSLVIVDTLNNHMPGDENSARDTRELVNACKIVMDALGCAVCLNHHIGHGGEARGRARGSSAWKASLDSSILVSKSEEIITVSSTKMKDAKPPESIHGELRQVVLDWKDGEDGEDLLPQTGVTSAVFDTTESRPTEKVKNDTKLGKYKKQIVTAWFACGAEILDELPYLSRSGLLNHLVVDLGMDERTAKQYLKPSNSGRLVSELLTGEVIEVRQHGWVVKDNILASTMLLQRQEKC